MNDLELYAALQNYRDQGLDAVMITIVEARGSTPRGVGAKMFILPNGKSCGTIGGGCVEARIRSVALDVLIEKTQARIVTSHLNDSLGVEDGDICGGTITALLEYIDCKSQ